jgi:hypothetical protein
MLRIASLTRIAVLALAATGLLVGAAPVDAQDPGRDPFAPTDPERRPAEPRIMGGPAAEDGSAHHRV